MTKSNSNRSSGGATIPNPLSREQCTTMFELAKYAKQHDLLDGYQRKAVFQAGRFDEWFPTRVQVIANALRELLPDLPGRDKSDLFDRTRAILASLESVDINAQGFATGRLDDEVETDVLRRAAIEGVATPEERLVLAELLEDQNSLKEAQNIALHLLEEFPLNSTVKNLCSRLKDKLKSSGPNRESTAVVQAGSQSAAGRATAKKSVGERTSSVNPNAERSVKLDPANKTAKSEPESSPKRKSRVNDRGRESSTTRKRVC